MGQVDTDMVALMDHTVTSRQVQDIVRRKHEHFNRYFYTCSVDILAGLSEMRVSDARFSGIFDKIKPGPGSSGTMRSRSTVPIEPRGSGNS
jgi:hypothetical protein